MPAWNRVRLPFLASNSKMPACSGYSAQQTGKPLPQAGKFGLKRRGELDSLLQVGRFGLQRAKLP
ncbi:hypothetical protein DQG23_30020 [Paenibacillus contaminans]|uniref:Uncharacterized protein n=1 Tax=Paenibacillus contaminans TaxID=450362 RepID=A0A329M6Q7_9BACL|nr:hypothetical protein DQG23_30020 [Paenibacillus contaminans]